MNRKECLLVSELSLIDLNNNVNTTRNMTFQTTLFMPNLYINTSNGEYFCGPLIMMVKELAIKHNIGYVFLLNKYRIKN